MKVLDYNTTLHHTTRVKGADKPSSLLFWDILDEFIAEREKEMSELVNLINVSKATNSKIKFPYWKLPLTSDKSVHPSPYESYLQDTYNNFCHDLDGKPHSSTTTTTTTVLTSACGGPAPS